MSTTPSTTPLAPRWRRLAARALWRARFLIAAGCVGIAAAVVVTAVTPEPPATMAVVVTARDVAAGSRISADDVRVVRVAAALAPQGAYRSPARARGRTASADLASGTVLTPGLLGGDQVARGAPDGRVVVALPAGDDPTSALLAPGDHVDLLAATADGSRYLARRALVLPAPASADGGSGGLLGTPGETAGRVLVVAVEPGEAEALAARPDGSRLTAVVVR